MRLRSGPARSGASTVEVAIVLPIVFMLSFGLLVGAMGIFRYQEVSMLAREGARYASTHGYAYRKYAGQADGSMQTLLNDAVTLGGGDTVLNDTIALQLGGVIPTGQYALRLYFRNLDGSPLVTDFAFDGQGSEEVVHLDENIGATANSAGAYCLKYNFTAVTNTVTVGPAAALEVFTVTGDRPVWTAGPMPGGPVECELQLRAHGEPVPAVVSVADGRLVAQLRRPARGVAAGQAMVAYRPDTAGDVVLGSATVR